MGSGETTWLISPQIAGEIRRNQRDLLSGLDRVRQCHDPAQVAERLHFLEEVLKESVELMEAVLHTSPDDHQAGGIR